MDIHIHIDDRLVAAVKRLAGGKRGVVLTTVGVLAGAGALYATSATPPNTFVSGTTISSSQVNTQFQQLYAGLNAVEGNVATLQAPKTCPSGMVEVGDVCVDKYEASVWARKDGAAVDCAALQAAVDGGTAATTYTIYGTASDDYPAGFPDTGNFTTKLYGCSIRGVTPSGSLTWFQAQVACGLSGKHLITNGEWQMAVQGTVDPGANAGADGSCNTTGGGPRAAGLGSEKCVSNWGVEDGIGNFWEWVDMWGQAGPTSATFVSVPANTAWPAAFGGDATWNINGSANLTGGSGLGTPAAGCRGGSWDVGTNSGAFSLNLNNGPSLSGDPGKGFRCAARHP